MLFNSMTKKIYKISGMHCSSCAMTIEWEFEDQGVTAKCDYAKQVLEVEIDSEEKEEIVKKIVEKLGYKLHL